MLRSGFVRCRGGHLIVWCSLLVGLMLVTATDFAAAQGASKVTQKTIERPYWVSGATAGQLVDYMRRYPLRGAKGAELANIRPRYNLNVSTRPGRTCSVASVNLHIEFTMTLPRGRQENKMDRKSRRLWKSFVGFTRKHELQHRQIYLDCARDFAASAKFTPQAASCGGLKAQVRQRMNAAMAQCEIRHQALDRGATARLKRLPLLRAASVR